MTYVLTTAFKPSASQENDAKALATSLQIPYQKRYKLSLKRIGQGYDGVFVLYKDSLRFVHPDGQMLCFHPDTAMLRLKAEHDPLRYLIGEARKSVLDLTMGLASDSILMAGAGHEVTALESELVPYTVMSYGLAHYHSNYAPLERAMRSIRTVHSSAKTFLEKQADASFDIIYYDPMFVRNIQESQNLSALSPLANHEPLSKALFEQMKRVARDKVIMKAHFQDDVFERFGFERLRRPNQKSHYGIYVI
ncbi:class I SAM-dependent methyltransferase [Streptococcus sp. zg-JUN1979]|uniref:class I SAM-dependent methyltransferase n=1 Tax=Streptococcus sp. zg-JUN1979 TaxID=3391450 RepID=UPI0039A5AFFB